MLTLLLWRRFMAVQIAVAVMAGFLWSGWHAQGLLAQRLLPEQEGLDITLSGWVASLPVQDAEHTRFSFEVERAEGVDAASFPRKLSLSWYDEAPSLRPGDYCHLVVRLKRPWGTLNPGGFDYEQLLFTRVVAVAERHGKPVKLLVVPSSNVFDAVAQTAVRLASLEIVVGESAKFSSAEQARLLGEAWERVSGSDKLRTRLVTVQGAAIPWPFGGKSRQVQIDLDTHALQARRASPGFNGVTASIPAQVTRATSSSAST